MPILLMIVYAMGVGYIGEAVGAMHNYPALTKLVWGIGCVVFVAIWVMVCYIDGGRPVVVEQCNCDDEDEE